MTLSVPRALGRPFTRPLARPAVRLACVLAAGAALAAAAAWRVRRWASDPATPLLIGRGGAAWIAAPEPFHLSCRRLGPYQAAFRKTFAAPGGAQGLVLELEAFKAAAVLVDGRLAAEPRLELRRWKEPLRIDLSALAAPGAHELLVHVYNENAPPALLARCDALGLATGQEGWEASAGGGAWTPARLAREPRRPAIAEAFPASLEAFAAQLPWALPLFLATAAASLWLGSRPQRPPWAAGLTLTPERVRWGLLFAWALLGANNILK
ncbi:MAG: hypothetical protein HY721_04620, partial [Planctomycetes bacterium]|nr:hypothetical protein [Planctomycetota bacterium]